MPELEYNVNVNVEGKEDVDELATDLGKIEENSTITVDATGVTETAEGLDAISANTEAAGVLDDVGTAAGEAAPKADEAAGAFGDMVGAISLVQVASFGLDFIMDKLAEKAARIKEQDAFDAAQVQEFADALRQAGDDASNLVDSLSDTDRIVGSFNNQEIDITRELAEANITADEFFRTLREDGVDGYEALLTKAEEAGLSEGEVNRVRAVASETLGQLGIANEFAAASTEVFAESQQSANAALQALLDEQDPMRRFSEEWATLVKGISDGSIDTATGTAALNTLSEGLDLSTEEVLALAQAQVDEGVAGALAFAEAQGSIDFRNADIEGATSAFAGYTAELFAAGNETQRIESAYAALATAVGDGALNLDTATESGRAQQDALEGVAAVLDGQFAQAYDNANGSQADFAAAATTLGDETLARLQTDLGLTDVQVETLRTTLGLTAADYDARFELAGVAEAQLQLGLLQGAIEGLPPEVETRVNTLITQGDYVGARDVVATFYADNPVPLPAEAETTAAEGDIAAVAEAEYPATIEAQADLIQAQSDLIDEAAKTRTTIIAASALTTAARLDLQAVADEERTARINVGVGSVSLPSSAQLAGQIGPVRVQIIGVWSTRLEGSRPR